MLKEGTVKFFNGEKGFGFITPKNGGDDIFVHITEVQNQQALNDGESVKYEEGQGKKGPCAINVENVN